ncbi:CoA transferase [Nakamurella lactea]|uniref:CoA transferase n=1 Tax=Nakamurella lactea TaxID=459515 RepID=UPI0004009AA6|nr:CoA transferase [Nakamurella lactea]
MPGSTESAPGVDDSRGPLSGLWVVEISSFVAAPLGGMTLAQLGAQVIRVDPIGGAADRDRWPVTSSGASLYWAGLNKGKRSLVADLRSETGRGLIRDLVAGLAPGTGVVLTNSAGRGGLAADDLTAVCPDLIHVEILGRPDGSPAVDYTVNAGLGFPSITGPDGWSGPVNHVLPAWDVACGLYAAVGICAAALRRSTTGAGERIRLALSDVALATAGNLGLLAEAQVNGVDRPRVGNHMYGSFARDFACADGGRIMVVALTQRHWRDLVALTDIANLVSALEAALSVDFSLEADRYTHREVLADLVQAWFSRHDADAAAAGLAKTSVLWERYRTFTDVVADLTAGSEPADWDHDRAMMRSLDQPGIGQYLAPASPLDLISTRRAPQPAPLLGEHTVELLRERLSMDPEVIAVLCRDGVVFDGSERSKGIRDAPTCDH